MAHPKALCESLRDIHNSLLTEIKGMLAIRGKRLGGQRKRLTKGSSKNIID